jgi:uncharacterized protein YggT (Ycf19 family)
MVARLLDAVSWLISIIEVALFIRAIASWFLSFPPAQAVYQVMCVFTDPIVEPIRRAMQKFPQFSQMPVDLSVLFAYFVLELVRRLLF